VPEDALPYLNGIYRPLLSRPTQSCTVFCVGVETGAYLTGRIVQPDTAVEHGTGGWLRTPILDNGPAMGYDPKRPAD